MSNRSGLANDYPRCGRLLDRNKQPH